LATVRRHPDCVAIMCGATECSSTGAYPCYVNFPASAPLDPSSAPQKRCTAFSKSWDEQCELPDGHDGDHASGHENVDELGRIPPIHWTDDKYRGEGAC
jgi:hypothetical protein